MSDKIYDIPPEWTKRGYVDDAKYQEMYARSIKDPNGFWAEEAKRLHWYTDADQDQEHVVRARRRLDQVVRGRRHQRRLQLHRPAPGEARAADRDHLGRRRSDASPAHHLSGTARRGLPVRQHPAQPQRREGRPRHHLHADDPGGGRSRCSPARASARSTRWCSAASRRSRSPAASRTASSKVVITADEGLRGGRKVPLKANVDAAIAKVARRRSRHRRAPHRRRVDMDPVRDVW